MIVFIAQRSELLNCNGIFDSLNNKTNRENLGRKMKQIKLFPPWATTNSVPLSKAFESKLFHRNCVVANSIWNLPECQCIIFNVCCLVAWCLLAQQQAVKWLLLEAACVLRVQMNRWKLHHCWFHVFDAYFTTWTSQSTCGTDEKSNWYSSLLQTCLQATYDF